MSSVVASIFEFIMDGTWREQEEEGKKGNIRFAGLSNRIPRSKQIQRVVLSAWRQRQRGRVRWQGRGRQRKRELAFDYTMLRDGQSLVRGAQNRHCTRGRDRDLYRHILFQGESILALTRSLAPNRCLFPRNETN